VSNIELVVEVGSSFSEVPLDFTVERQSGLDDMRNLLLDRALKLAEVLVQVSRVDSGQR